MIRIIILCVVVLVVVVCVMIVGVVGLVMVQSLVIIYGIIDIGVVYIINVNVNGNLVFKMLLLMGSFLLCIGFCGMEDLGGGLQVIFVLESGFVFDIGVMGQGNCIFGCQLYVGLKSDWGQVILGCQINMIYILQLKMDVMGFNIFVIGSIDLYLFNVCSDNFIGYFGSFSGFMLGVIYSFGCDSLVIGGLVVINCVGEVVGNSKVCCQVMGLLGYDGKGWGVIFFYDILYGNIGVFGGFISSDNSDQCIILNGYFMIGDVKIGGGVVDCCICVVNNINIDFDFYYLGVSYLLIIVLVLDVQVLCLDVKNSLNDVIFLVVCLIYNLFKCMVFYILLGYIKNGGMLVVVVDVGGLVGVGKNQLGVMLGICYIF